MNATTTQTVNGINVDGVLRLVEAVKADPANAQTHWAVSTKWSCRIGGKECPKNFSIGSDEPVELGGTNVYPNPQELLLAALNACMTVGYVANASLMGIELESLQIESEGDIDLRGFLGLEPTVKAGYDHVNYTVKIKGNGTPEQFEQLHRAVTATSPNRFNIAQPVKLNAKLVVG
jgi:uncharacterized OsmC-like protein